MSEVKLQVALDFLELARAIKVAEMAVEGGADSIEAGTPLIKSEGLDAVRTLRNLFPHHRIVADMKTMDTGRIETESAAKAGANVITVSAAASFSTVRECVETGRHYGIEIALDLLGVEDEIGVARRAAELGVAVINIHCPIDAQMHGEDPLSNLHKIRSVTSLPLAVAGGLNSETAALAAEAGADIIVVGGAITKAVDPKKASMDIRRAIDTRKPVPTLLFKRTALSEVREILQKVRTCNISDGAHRLPCLEGLKPLVLGYSVCGPAVTVRTVPGDWAKPVEAIDRAKSGDVIVIDAGGRPPAVWGELATESAKNRGVSGIVIHGAVRDSADIRRLGFPVWTKLITSHAGDPHGLGEIDQPIVISGQRILPGDWIAADDDGVMVLPRSRLVEMVNRAADVLEAENRIRHEIRDGKTSLAKVLNLLRWEKKESRAND